MLSPSSEEWFLIVLVVDALFLLTALGGIKLLGLSRRAVGMLSLLVGIIIFVLGVQNLIHAPPPDSLRDIELIPVPTFLHYVVYILVAICLLVGAWLIARPTKKTHKAI